MKVTSRSRTREAKGDPARFSGLNFLYNVVNVSSSNPVPTFPTYSSFPRLYTPSNNAPKKCRAPLGSVNPPITNSSSLRTLTFNQAADRPETYLDERSFAMSPSKPRFLAISNALTPSASNRAERIRLDDG